jgi:hypothetical protein
MGEDRGALRCARSAPRRQTRPFSRQQRREPLPLRSEDEGQSTKEGTAAPVARHQGETRVPVGSTVIVASKRLPGGSS